MTDNTIFTTGATSIAGRQVVAELMARNHRVVALEREPVTLEGCSVLVCPLEHIEHHAQDISQADAIVHLASSHSLERHTVLKEIAGTSALIDAWRKGPFVYASSVWLEAGLKCAAKLARETTANAMASGRAQSVINPVTNMSG